MKNMPFLNIKAISCALLYSSECTKIYVVFFSGDVMKKGNLSKTAVFCIAILAAAFVYGLVLPLCWGNNPLSPTGTLSLLCEDRKIYFWLWGILTCGSIALNTQYMYKKFSYKNRLFDAFCIMSVVSVCLVALTLGHSIEDWNPKRIAHWIATGMYIVFTIAPVLLFFLVNIKKYKGFVLYAVCTVLIFSTFVFIFAFVGKSALMEMVPVALLQIFLFVMNFTPFVKVCKIKQSA